MKIDKKLDYWKKRLLDFTRRNRLLNCPLPSVGKRLQRNTLIIEAPSPTELWTLFTVKDGELIFSLPSKDQPTEYQSSTSAPIVTPPTNYIKTNQTPNETNKTLQTLMKKTKEVMEEKGLNTLYIAFGFLTWQEKGTNGQALRSPLLLIPAKLTQEDLFSPFILSRTNEEITINTTLRQKLLNDFNLEIPQLSDTMNLIEYVFEVNQIVKPLGWVVSNDVAQVSLFSFMKINMYQDLESNAKKICKHPIVQALNGKPLYLSSDLPQVSQFDHDSVKPQEVFSVVDADSSQQDAILLAKKGFSFVLQGPPGTGKSQTITNIIAELIGEGKKVLFVSEKVAALEVVYKRLTQVGLGNFCLSLHSHNAKRREILDQLDKSIKMSRMKHEVKRDAYNSLIHLKEIRTKLNQYANNMHTMIEPLGKTIFQVNGILAHLENYKNIDYVLPSAETFTLEHFTQCELALDEIARIVSKSGYQINNPWNGCSLENPPTFEFRQRFVAESESLIQILENGSAKFEIINQLLDNNGYFDSYANCSAIRNIFDFAKKCPSIEISWLTLDLNSQIALLESCMRYLQNCDKHKEAQLNLLNVGTILENQKLEKHTIEDALKNAKGILLENYFESILNLDVSNILERYRTGYRSWVRLFNTNYHKDRKTLVSHCKRAEKLSYEKGLLLLDSIKNVQTLEQTLKEKNHQISITQESFNSLNSDYSSIVSELQNDLEINPSLLPKNNVEKVTDVEQTLFDYKHNFPSSVGYTTLVEHLHIEISDKTDFENLKMKLAWGIEFQKYINEYHLGIKFITAVCKCDNVVMDQLSDILEKLKDWENSIAPKIEKFALYFHEQLHQSIYSMPLKKLVEQVDHCQGDFTSLEYLIDYQIIRSQLQSLGIDSYLDKVKEINLTAESIVPVFKKCFFRSWLDAVGLNHAGVRNFRRLQQDKRIVSFKDLDKSHIEISRAILVSKLVDRLPNLDVSSSGGEMGLLRREMAKQKKLMPTRLLIAALPNVLPALKPCMMMSPLSVSTYLGDSDFEFDTVIFDEASQVRTEDAICAIYRAKQAIIAGDSKQLPPTSFFSSSISISDEFEEDENGDIDDSGAYESLLDEASILPTQTLLWHYRSRHEDLIAFSNEKIYQGNLVTFPSSIEKSDGMGVEYVYVQDGIYDRGGKKGNKVEAKKVAELVFEHFKQYPNRSIGIIAFSEVQQSEIQEEIEVKRRANPSFETFFREDKEESLFIKNLETVQGDERDTIIFSIGYAPDSSGKFLMNFGPLSRSGGERRLNVAVTRARFNLKLVGSIMPTDIQTENISGQGPKLLRQYIEFAISGTKMLVGEKISEQHLWDDSTFEACVYNFLIDSGFDVETRIGCSGYRIDMAIRDPKNRMRYALGIECDGLMYRSARTARERDRLRHTVLENMGWKIYQVWSTDWIKDQYTERKLLLEAIQRAIEPDPQLCNQAIQSDMKNRDFVNVIIQSESEHIKESLSEKSSKLSSVYYGRTAKDIPITDICDVMKKVIDQNFGIDKNSLFKEAALYGYGWERQGVKIKEKFEEAFLVLVKSGSIEVSNKNGTIKLLNTITPAKISGKK